MLTKWMTKFAVAAICIAALTLPQIPILAQSTTQGAITGTVFDPTDAVVGNAAVVIHNNATNAETTVKTDSSGSYRAPQLEPGTYTVTVTAPGFAELRSSGLVVQVSQATEFNVHLKTGSTTAVIEVTAEVPVLKFDSPEFGGHLETQEIENIPINNRRWSALALTTPGVANDAN